MSRFRAPASMQFASAAVGFVTLFGVAVMVGLLSVAEIVENEQKLRGVLPAIRPMIAEWNCGTRRCERDSAPVKELLGNDL